MADQTYPNAPGWKGSKPSGREAAEAIAPTLGRRQAEVLKACEQFGVKGATCDQIGKMLHRPTYVVRPRASELERMGKLFALPVRRRGAMGFYVTVYSTVRPEGADADG